MKAGPETSAMNGMRMARLTLLSLVLMLGCATGGPQLAKLTPDQLYAHGLERLKAHKWTPAAEAFERFSFEYADDPRYQEARYHLGEARFGGKEYITAATEFARLASDFPAGPWADESRFKVCESYAKLSPRVELDQEYTTAAIDHCEALLSYNPDSPFVGPARELIVQLREKLAEKVLLAGMYYQRRNAFDSAIKYYQEAVTTYPATGVAPRALLRLVRVYEQLEYKEEATTAREKLLKDYPTSPEAKELERGTAAAK